MAFNLKGEYKRLQNILYKHKGKIPFECGCACGMVTEIEYQPLERGQQEAIFVYGFAGWDKPYTKNMLFAIEEHDVKRRYQDRKYRYNKQYEILELLK